MKTFILFWNPAISSYKLDSYRDFLAEEPEFYDFNWSIWEHQMAHEGDRFFMVRCKNKPVPGQVNQWGKQVWEPCIDATTGICMAGTFSSEPYRGEDWSGNGRETYYMDMWIDHASDPDKCIILSSEELSAAIPEFDWTGGHSGRMLDDAAAEKLEELFAKAVEKKKDSIWTPEVRCFID